MAKTEESLCIAWCDNGTTDAKFTEGLVSVAAQAPSLGIKISRISRMHGNQIGRQRDAMVNTLLSYDNFDWILWVDSDIFLTSEILSSLWSFADKETMPIISGIYFTSQEGEVSVPAPLPTIFYETEDQKLVYIHPLPENAIVECELAGFGLLLMHKSVLKRMKEVFPDESLFMEYPGLNEKFVGEDIMFFRKMKKAGIKLHAYTGAIAKHVKRFYYDENYYKMYWKMKEIENDN